ncbi:MAG: CsbD family protein [Pseudomonadota bacterium]
MNTDVLEGKWSEFKGEAKAKWGELTDDDLAKAEGDAEALVGALQAKYGYERAKAEREVEDWVASLKS